MTQWAFQSAAESLESKLFIQRTVYDHHHNEDSLDHNDLDYIENDVTEENIDAILNNVTTHSKGG